MKKKLKVIIKKIKKNLSKDKYYWKRKYYKTLRELNLQNERNLVLSEDLRNTYSKYKYYSNLYFESKAKLKAKKKKGGNR